MLYYGTKITRRYDTDYKIQSVKLAEEIGIPVSTLNGWIKAAGEGRLNLGLGSQIPSSAMLADKLFMIIFVEKIYLGNINTYKMKCMKFLRKTFIMIHR